MNKWWLAVLVPFLACTTDTENQVQFSSEQPASYFVTVDPAKGFIPTCLTMETGKTVEWENADPVIPANVTGLGDPPELYSPNLQGEFVTWRHTFDEPGFFEYFDTNTGDPGRRIVDAYYGTVTYVGVSESTQRGAVCVRDDNTTGSCCCHDFDCNVPAEVCVVNVCQPAE